MFWLVVLAILVLLALALLALFDLVQMHSVSLKKVLRHRRLRWCLGLCLLILISLLALSGCGTQPSQGKQPPQQVPAELMKAPAKPILLAPTAPVSTSTTPGTTTQPTPAPAPKTERAISA